MTNESVDLQESWSESKMQNRFAVWFSYINSKQKSGMKTSKYLICNDIMAKDDQPAEFILHNHHPRFLAKVEELDFNEIENRPEKPFADILYINGKGTMLIYRLTVTESYERAEDEDILDELFPARDYYTRYLQDIEAEDGEKEGFPVKDFSPELPGLKILQSADNCTVIYNGVIAEFSSEEEMDEFLENDLGIEPVLLDKGVINQFD